MYEIMCLKLAIVLVIHQYIILMNSWLVFY